MNIHNSLYLVFILSSVPFHHLLFSQVSNWFANARRRLKNTVSSLIWVGPLGSNSTNNMSRATRKDWASAAMTPALMVRHSLMLAHTVTRVKTTEPNYSAVPYGDLPKTHSHSHKGQGGMWCWNQGCRRLNIRFNNLSLKIIIMINRWLENWLSTMFVAHLKG